MERTGVREGILFLDEINCISETLTPMMLQFLQCKTCLLYTSRKAHATGAKVAVDVQCMLRHVEDDKSMQFHDWADKLTYLPEIDFLKTDATEAAILTGLDDRAEAARQLHAWGAKEVMVTHNTEVLIYDGTQIYTCPIVARNLSGRTGRGDT